ncbi:hypothetical protein OH76DRAFT_1400214 [Lentinus brumalis]|uniref:Uncharacterized protein n=1 Tax=Lentinus brumalis TaxID=2498619 RepID=A0A371DIQ4_9APHY|nr:hypothetical protein OH76DRAFT_1400214 [Polyporus brumalis]
MQIRNLTTGLLALLALATSTVAAPLADVHTGSLQAAHGHGRLGAPEIPLVQDSVPSAPVAPPKAHSYTRRARSHP